MRKHVLVLLQSGLLVAWSHSAFTQDQVLSSLTGEKLLARPIHTLGPSEDSVRLAFEAVLLGSDTAGGEATVERCAEDSQKVVFAHRDTLRDGLDSIAATDPRYRWIVADGVINLLPVDGIPALLQTRIKTFDSKDADHIASAGTLLFVLPVVQNAAARLGLTQQLAGSALSGIAARPTAPPKPLVVRLRDTTVLEALNAIVRANGRGVWVYREVHCSTENLFHIAFTQ